jgi:hypothetical protein
VALLTLSIPLAFYQVRGDLSRSTITSSMQSRGHTQAISCPLHQLHFTAKVILSCVLFLTDTSELANRSARAHTQGQIQAGDFPTEHDAPLCLGDYPSTQYWPLANPQPLSHELPSATRLWCDCSSTRHRPQLTHHPLLHESPSATELWDNCSSMRYRRCMALSWFSPDLADPEPL